MGSTGATQGVSNTICATEILGRSTDHFPADHCFSIATGLSTNLFSTNLLLGTLVLVLVDEKQKLE
jgi:hypothetical protein